MDSVDLVPLIEQLDDNIDDLEEALSTVIRDPLSDIAGKLPLLDKAQLYVLITYAIESLLFSFLRLNGVNAKEHPVFRELTRVKQYFDKINTAESGDSKRENTLDKPAAGRFIRHALAGNDKYDLKRAQQQAGEKARARQKFEQLSIKRECEDDQASASNSNSQSSSSPVKSIAAVIQSTDTTTSASEDLARNELTNAVSEEVQDDTPVEPSSVKVSKSVKKRKKHRTAEYQQNKSSVELTSIDEPRSAKKRRKREKGSLSQTSAGGSGPEEPIIPKKHSQVSASGSASFQALISGNAPDARSRNRKQKKEAKRAAAYAAKEE